MVEKWRSQGKEARLRILPPLARRRNAPFPRLALDWAQKLHGSVKLSPAAAKCPPRLSPTPRSSNCCALRQFLGSNRGNQLNGQSVHCGSFWGKIATQMDGPQPWMRRDGVEQRATRRIRVRGALDTRAWQALNNAQAHARGHARARARIRTRACRPHRRREKARRAARLQGNGDILT